MSPPPAMRTSPEELLGSTTGIIVTAVAASLALVGLIAPVFLAARTPNARRPKGQRAAQDAGSGQGHWPSERLEDRHVPERGHPHGKPRSWVLVAVMTAAFLTGGLAIIAHTWWLFWAATAIFFLGVPVGKAIGIMDDTVIWGTTPAAANDRHPGVRAGPGKDQAYEISEQ